LLDHDFVGIIPYLRGDRHKLLHHASARIRCEVRKALEQVTPAFGMARWSSPSAGLFISTAGSTIRRRGALRQQRQLSGTLQKHRYFPVSRK
jgi:hypothetical protein